MLFAIKDRSAALVVVVCPPLWQVVLFTNKDHVPGVFKALSLRFRNVAKLGFGWCRAHDETNKPIVDQIAPSKVSKLKPILGQIAPGNAHF